MPEGLVTAMKSKASRNAANNNCVMRCNARMLVMLVHAQPRRPGRPREPVPEDVAEDLLEWISDGKPLTSFCALPGKPSRRSVHDWRKKDPEFRRQFDIAREMGFDYLADEALHIADEPRPEGAGRGWLASQRLRIKTRFWLMSRWYPKRRPRAYRSRRATESCSRSDVIKPEVRVVEKAP